MTRNIYLPVWTAATVMLLACGTLLADDITLASGTELKGVRIIGLEGTQLVFLRGSSSTKRDLSEIQSIDLTEVPELAKALKLMSASPSSAAGRLKRLGRKLKPELKPLGNYYLCQAYDKAGNFDLAVKAYADMIRANPDLAKFAPGNLPKEEDQIKTAIAVIDREAGRMTTDATKKPMEALKANVQSGQAQAITAEPEDNRGLSTTLVTGSTSVAGAKSIGLVNKLRLEVDNKQYDDAKKTAAQLIKGLPDIPRATAAHWAKTYQYLGDAHMGLKEYRPAVLAYMRVVINYPDDLNAVECLIRAAEAYGLYGIESKNQEAISRAIALLQDAQQQASEMKNKSAGQRLIDQGNELIKKFQNATK